MSNANDTIPLHPERMLDPHKCFCPQCGTGTDELTIGAIWKTTIKDNVIYTSNKIATSKEIKAKYGNIPIYYEEVGEYEKVPGSLCNTCIKINSLIEQNEAIALKCDECNFFGALMAHHPLAQEILSKNAKGLQFKTCKEHLEMGIDPNEHTDTSI